MENWAYLEPPEPTKEDKALYEEERLYFLQHMAFENINGYDVFNSRAQNLYFITREYKKYLKEGVKYDDCTMSESFIYNLDNYGLDVSALGKMLEQGDFNGFLDSINKSAEKHAEGVL